MQKILFLLLLSFPLYFKAQYNSNMRMFNMIDTRFTQQMMWRQQAMYHPQRITKEEYKLLLLHNKIYKLSNKIKKKESKI